jgi:trimeric autotransporter adhesin
VLGNASTDRAATTVTSGVINGQTYTYAGPGSAASGVVSVGSVGGERQIINVAAGAVNASSTDAVNGSQLFATHQAIDSLGSQVSSIDARVTTIDARVTNIDARMFTTETKVQNIDARVTTLQGDMSQLQGGVAALAGGADGFFQVSQERRDHKPQALGQNSAAGGMNALATGNDALAVGNDAQATGSKTVALGQAAMASAPNSVALGAEAQATRGATQDYAAIGVGAGQKSAGEVSVGTQGAERQITHVAPGRAGTDAVNVNQLAGALQGVGKRIDDIGKDSRAGTAAAMAMANMPQAFIPGKSMLAAGVSTYRGQTAAAVGLSRMSASGRAVINFSGSVDSRGSVGLAAGFGVHW